jgi:hypothetical protein
MHHAGAGILVLPLFVQPVGGHESCGIAANESLAYPVIISRFDNHELFGRLNIQLPSERPPHVAQSHAPHLCVKQTWVLERFNACNALPGDHLIAEGEVVQFEGDAQFFKANEIVFVERHTNMYTSLQDLNQPLAQYCFIDRQLILSPPPPHAVDAAAAQQVARRRM